MELVAADQTFNFNWSAYDQNPSLNVAFYVYLANGGVISPFPILVPASYAGYGLYTGTFSDLQLGDTYLVIGAAFTDDTYTTVNPLYGPNANSFQVLGPTINYFIVNYASYDANSELFIRARIFDVSSGTPNPISNMPMTYVNFGVYFASFTGNVGSTYAAATIVYTDNSYSEVDPNRAPGSESFDAIETTVTQIVIGSAILEGQELDGILIGDCS